MNNTDLEKKVRELTSQLLTEKGYVAMIDVFLGLGYLSEQDVKQWRMRKIPFLEKCIKLNLSKISFVCKAVRINCINMKLKERYTAYKSWGKGAKVDLQFSKSGQPNIEKSYSTHYVGNRIEA